MIVITTPTGQIGSQTLARLLDNGESVRVIVRDPAKLDATTRQRAAVIEGSHDESSVLDAALAGADALFWLVPPNFQAPSAEAHYLAFTRPAVEAIRRHQISHVVGITSAGHGWPRPAGLLSAAFAMDAELASSGAAYRALAMPFYMENLLHQLDAIREQGAFALPHAADRPLAMTATRDIAATAAALLSDRSWSGSENVPVFGPDRLTPNEMAQVMSEVLGRPVGYTQTSIEDFTAAMAARGSSRQAIRGMVEMTVAQGEGIYDADWGAATPTATSFQTWFESAV